MAPCCTSATTGPTNDSRGGAWSRSSGRRPATPPNTRRNAAICTVRLLSSTAWPGHAASISASFATTAPGRSTNARNNAIARRPSVKGSAPRNSRSLCVSRRNGPNAWIVIGQSSNRVSEIFRNFFGSASGLSVVPEASCDRVGHSAQASEVRAAAQGAIGPMSFASEASPPVGFSRSVASSYPRSFVPGFAERVRLPLLLGLTVAGFILYSQATAPSVGRLAVFAGIAVAGAVSGISGLAFPLIAGPIFLLMYPAPEAVALTAMCSLTGQLFSIALLWRAIAYEFRVPLIAAGLLGAPLGSALLCSFNPHCVRVVLGALIVASGLWRARAGAGRGDANAVIAFRGSGRPHRRDNRRPGRGFICGAGDLVCGTRLRQIAPACGYPALHSNHAGGLPGLLVGLGSTGFQYRGPICRFRSARSGRNWRRSGQLPWACRRAPRRRW